MAKVILQFEFDTERTLEIIKAIRGDVTSSDSDRLRALEAWRVQFISEWEPFVSKHDLPTAIRNRIAERTRIFYKKYDRDLDKWIEIEPRPAAHWFFLRGNRPITFGEFLMYCARANSIPIGGVGQVYTALLRQAAIKELDEIQARPESQEADQRGLA